MPKVYITKYALTSGIFAVDGELFSNDSAVSYQYKGSHWRDHAHGKDFHLMPDSAIERAEEMRIRKLKALDKQMKKVSAIKFEIKE